MLLVPSLDAVRFVWIKVKASGLPLYGFLLFLGADHFFPEYFNDEGLADLEGWTGGTCSLFILQSPSTKWIDYAKNNDHLWWKLLQEISGKPSDIELDPFMSSPRTPWLEHDTDRSFRTPLSKYEHIRDVPLLEIDARTYSIRDIFSPCLNHFQHTMEIQKILFRFNLPPTSHPCLIFFKDWFHPDGWFVDLADLLDAPRDQLRLELKRWFAGRAFRGILAEAMGA